MRFILADHHSPALWALKITLAGEPELELVGEALDGQSLLALAETCAAELVLMDRGLPGGSIEILIADLHNLNPRPIVIVMSSRAEDSRKMLKSGADAFVSKGDPSDWLLETLRQYAQRPGGAGATA